MAFKSDSIRLKNYAATGDVSGPAQGELAIVSNALNYYNGSAWSAVDSSFSNLNAVQHQAWGSTQQLPSGTSVASLVYYNTTDQNYSTYELQIPPIASYAAYAQVHVINGSPAMMRITRQDAGDASFNWQTGGGTVNQVDIGLGQRALFMKTSTKWEVVVLSI